jgi:cytidine deaminase
MKNSKKAGQKITEKIQDLHRAAVQAKKFSYSPYSNFQVGAALLTKENEVIFGTNIENASFGATICAERTAILKAVSEAATQFTDIVIVTDAKTPTPPCAQCLQVMAEFFSNDTRIWLGNSKKILKQYKFKELLPQRFGPKDLGHPALYEQK